MLALGATLLGAGTVIAMDIDENALEVLQENIEDTGVTNIDPILCDFLGSKVYK